MEQDGKILANIICDMRANSFEDGTTFVYEDYFFREDDLGNASRELFLGQITEEEFLMIYNEFFSI